MFKSKETLWMVVVGSIIGIIAAVLVVLGNPANMGFCIACFIRDMAGAFGLHRAGAVQYARPEIIGLILGSFLIAFGTKEFKARGGSAPVTRFVLGFFVMIGALMFLGCPFRMILRIAGGDLNAIVGLVGFAVGIGVGVYFLNRGFTLKRSVVLRASDGVILPVAALITLFVLLFVPSLLLFTEAGAGPGAMYAPLWISLIAGALVGIMAQRTRFCMVGGIRDFILFREWKLLLGFLAVIVSAGIVNVIAGNFTLGFAGQPIAHTDGLWNFLGMLTVGFGSTLLGGCPLRQLILSGEGNSDSVVTVLGLFAGAAFAHNFGLASSGKGPTSAGMIAVVLGIVIMLLIAFFNSKESSN